MHGSLALENGVVWLARYGKGGGLAAYDLDGHRLGPAFELGTVASGAPRVSGIEVDGEHGLWIADEERGCVRGFSVFGVEGKTLGSERAARASCVATSGEDDGRRIWIGCAGRRHDAVQAYAPDGELVGGLRCMGDPAQEYRDVSGIAMGERLSYVCEWRAGRVQVFRDLDFHFAFGLERGAAFEPTAAAPLSDGRVLVTSRGADSGLFLFDEAGRLMARLAEAGEDSGQVFEPSDVVVEEGYEDRLTRIVVVDRDGDRVQVFSLSGACYGSFPELT